MVWLGASRGYLTDWVTQRWVQLTGRRVGLAQAPWLAGPIGRPHGIGKDFFVELAREEDLDLAHGGERGLVRDFGALAASDFDPARIDPEVVDFYTRTSAYELDSWAEWCGAFRPFGWLLARLFSRRLQQLNVPLSGLDTSRGVTSEVLHLVNRRTGLVRHTAWVRRLLGTGHVLYAGSYALAELPGRRGMCVKVVFPLPNGNAIVLMRPVAHDDGSLTVVSAGRRFGDAGFYFTVAVPGRGGEVWARYVRALKERIHVYPDRAGGVRADHVLTLWGATFLRLHYRLRR
ncbi:MAG: hypothetical protein HYR51_06260 [Candidatus Rokubacteria bacterium]|nr:hypothetical protein [Candidatus Rokubacteria bacterium]